jgi:hypothetical protein
MSDAKIKKILQDLQSQSTKRMILALMHIPRIQNFPQEPLLVEQLKLEISQCLISENPDVSFLAKKAQNSLSMLAPLEPAANTAPTLIEPEDEFIDFGFEEEVDAVDQFEFEGTQDQLEHQLKNLPANFTHYEKIIPLFQNEEPRVVAFALEAYSRFATQSEILQYVTPFLWHENNRIRANAIVIAGALDFSQVQDSLESMMDTTRISMRESAVWAIGELPPNTALKNLLLNALHDPYRDIRLRAIDILSEYPYEDVINQMKRLSNDMDIEICEKAIKTLQHLESLPPADSGSDFEEEEELSLFEAPALESSTGNGSDQDEFIQDEFISVDPSANSMELESDFISLDPEPSSSTDTAIDFDEFEPEQMQEPEEEPLLEEMPIESSSIKAFNEEKSSESITQEEPAFEKDSLTKPVEAEIPDLFSFEPDESSSSNNQEIEDLFEVPSTGVLSLNDQEPPESIFGSEMDAKKIEEESAEPETPFEEISTPEKNNEEEPPVEETSPAFEDLTLKEDSFEPVTEKESEQIQIDEDSNATSLSSDDPFDDEFFSDFDTPGPEKEPDDVFLDEPAAKADTFVAADKTFTQEDEKPSYTEHPKESEQAIRLEKHNQLIQLWQQSRENRIAPRPELDLSFINSNVKLDSSIDLKRDFDSCIHKDIKAWLFLEHIPEQSSIPTAKSSKNDAAKTPKASPIIEESAEPDEFVENLQNQIQDLLKRVGTQIYHICQAEECYNNEIEDAFNLILSHQKKLRLFYKKVKTPNTPKEKKIAAHLQKSVHQAFITLGKLGLKESKMKRYELPNADEFQRRLAQLVSRLQSLKA